MLERKIDEFPNEILAHIFSFLRQTDFIHVSRVNHLFFSIASNDALSKLAMNNHSADTLLLSYIYKNVCQRPGVAILPNNQIAIGCRNGKINIWDYNNEEIVNSFCGLGQDKKNPEILCVCYIGQDKIISTVFDKTARIFNYKTSQCLGTVQLERSARCATLLNNNEIALGCNDGKIRIVNYDTFQVTREFGVDKDWLQRLCKLPNNEIAVTSINGLIRIYNYNNNTLIKTLNLIHYNYNWNNDVIYLGNDKIATSHEDGLRIWNYQTGECLHMLLGEASKYYDPHLNKCTAIIPIGKNKIACSRGNFMEIWNFETGKLLQKIDDHRQVMSYTLHS